MRQLLSIFASLIVLLSVVSSSFAEISTVRNFYQFDDRILTSGQPREELLKSAAEDGIEVVINLVPTTEGIYNPNEGKILQSQGIQYFHNPVSWSSPTQAELETFLNAMKEAEGKKVLVHCWSNARASAMVYAYRVSKAPENQEAELENLKKVWKEIAGYDLETNKTWQKFLAENVNKAQ